MLRLLPVLLLALALPLMGRADRPKGKKYALLVGVKSYEHNKLPDLKYTENDVEELAKILRKKGRFDQVVLTTSRGAKAAGAKPTAKNIARALKALLAKKTKHDTLLVALSGHGAQVSVKDPRGKGKVKELGFFCPADAQLSDANYKSERSPSMVNLAHLFQDLDGSGAGIKLLLVDACRNEVDSKGPDTDSLKPARGIAALFSCAASQKSYESGKLGKGHGVFFHYVLKGLGGEARNKKGEVTWDRLVTYVKEEVPAAVREVIGGGAEQSPHELKNLVNIPVLVGTDVGERKLELAKEIENSIGMKLKLIPKGDFMMGSPKDEKDRSEDEGPQHRVWITKPFYMGVYTVTQKQYEKVMSENPSYFSASGGGKERVKGLDTDDFPVDSVSWHDAKKFCDKLSALPKEKKAGRVYRLPREAEWEYACRAGTTTPFHYGKSLSSEQANFDGNYPYGGADKGPYLKRPSKVGSYKPNAWGLYDMHGNVWQWCQDWYKKDYYAESDKEDPKGPESGTARVLRGGSRYSNGWVCRAADRGRFVPGRRLDIVGFRVVCVAPRTP
jgi:formylglycine-generating enzyme required for sulfatase activity